MEIVDAGKVSKGYSYEISYDDKPKGYKQERQNVNDYGIIPIGPWKVGALPAGSDGRYLSSRYTVSIDKTWTGKITIYAPTGEMLATTSFRASVKTAQAEAAFHPGNIVETSREVFYPKHQKWDAPKEP